MPDRDDWLQESDDEFDEDEFPDENDEDDSTETVSCPSCGADVYEDAEQCPYCGTYITHQTSPWEGRSMWWIVLAVLGLVATILALSGAFF
jgi:uncharacterized paraquat-inducible protein A